MMLSTNLPILGVKLHSWGHITAQKVLNFKKFKIAESSYTNVIFDAEHEYDTLRCHISIRRSCYDPKGVKLQKIQNR